MKKIIIPLLFISLFSGANYIEQHYTRKNCKVIDIENNIVTVEDAVGYTWTFEDEGYVKGDVVNLKMFTNGTENINDDIILKVER